MINKLIGTGLLIGITIGMFGWYHYYPALGVAVGCGACLAILVLIAIIWILE